MLPVVLVVVHPNARTVTLFETSFKIEDDYQQAILSIGSKRSKMLDPSSPLDHEVSPLRKQKTLL